MFEKDLKGNLYKIWNRMSWGSYIPPPVRLVEIEKNGGGTRPLGTSRGADGGKDGAGAEVIFIPTPTVTVPAEEFEKLRTFRREMIYRQIGYVHALRHHLRNTDPKAQKHILGSRYTVIGTSDGGARPHTADRHEYSTHLLGHWVREKQIMPLEEAVHRLTGRTALMHDIDDRGFVAAGKVADLVLFDPDTIASKPREPVNDLPAGGTRVKRDAVGIDYVIVNGTVLLDKGELTDALPGQIVRGPLHRANHP